MRFSHGEDREVHDGAGLDQHVRPGRRVHQRVRARAPAGARIDAELACAMDVLRTACRNAVRLSIRVYVPSLSWQMIEFLDQKLAQEKRFYAPSSGFASWMRCWMWLPGHMMRQPFSSVQSSRTSAELMDSIG